MARLYWKEPVSDRGTLEDLSQIGGILIDARL